MAFDDIIPIDALLGKPKDPQYEDNTGGNKKKKKIDREAMQFAIMRIPLNGCKSSPRSNRHRNQRDLRIAGKICRKFDGGNKDLRP